MEFNEDMYYGYLIQGDLHSAIQYVGQFPDQHSLYERFLLRFQTAQDQASGLEPALDEILATYRQYYRNVFYVRINKEQATETLRKQLTNILKPANTGISLDLLEEAYLPEVFQEYGFQFLGGMTSGYYGPYIWRTTETVCFPVELPDVTQTYSLKLLDEFVSLSWLEYLSFGALTPGGWTDETGVIHCVRGSYDFESEHFQVSLLKHEAQHSADLFQYPGITPGELEYRAKLVELIYSRDRMLLSRFFHESRESCGKNGHAAASARITSELGTLMDAPIQKIQEAAKCLFRKSSAEMDAKYQN